MGKTNSRAHRLITAVMLAYTTFVSAFTSSIFSTATESIAAQYHVSAEVGLLGLSLYVLGFAIGPMFWAPFSELQGRRLPLVIAMFGFSIFQIGVAAAKDLQTIMLCRFWGGMFAASPLAVVAAVFADMFDNRSRGLAVTVFSMTVFSGPLLAPFIGGFMVESYLGWRWTEWWVILFEISRLSLNIVLTGLPLSWASLPSLLTSSSFKRLTRLSFLCRKPPSYAEERKTGESTPSRKKSKLISVNLSPRTFLVLCDS
jgi:multidrug resistance protein